MSVNSVEISYENARQYLIEESMNRPVLVDFWADWCAPCKVLMPLLEKLAHEYQGAFLLAKVNADALPDIGSQFGIRSLPTVIVMKDGQPVDAVQGAQPESAIRQLLDKHLPKPWDRKLASAEMLLSQNMVSEAIALLREAYTESTRRADIALQLAKGWLLLHRTEEAREVLEAVKLADRDGLYDQLLAQLELMEESAKAPEIQELEAKLNEDPNNKELAYELSVQFSQHEHTREALQLLLTILQEDLNYRDGGARKIYLDILATLAKGDPLAVEFQRKIYNLLY